MAKKAWIPLSSYSSKYGVSISTLRRRIKSQQAEFAYKDGKYLLLDRPLSYHQKDASASKLSTPPQAKLAPLLEDSLSESMEVLQESSQEIPALTTANRLLEELKKAYSLILQEREEQMILLKHEVADLKTLVCVLEEENQRLRGVDRDPALGLSEPWIDKNL